MIRIVRARRSEYFSGMTPAWIAAATLFAAAVFLAWWANRSLDAKITVCPLKLTAGLPCPFCGGTTATFHLATGEFAAAFRSNPLVAAAIPLFAAWSLLWLGFGMRIVTPLSAWAVTGLFLLLLALNWVWILARR